MATFLDVTQAGQYNVLSNSNDYEVISGLFALPVAEEEQPELDWSPVALVKAHSPYRIRQLQFRYDKTGNPPVIPAPESTGAVIFLNGSIGFASPKPNLSYTAFDWTVAGIYTFVENCRSVNLDGFVLGSFPFPTIMDQDNDQLSSTSYPYGAISQAGATAKKAATQAETINNNTGWLYNSVSYFPSILLNSDLANGSSPSFAGAGPNTPINADTIAGFPFIEDDSGDIGAGGDF